MSMTTSENKALKRKEKPLPCPVCGKKCNTVHGVRTHKGMVHDTAEERKKKKKLISRKKQKKYNNSERGKRTLCDGLNGFLLKLSKQQKFTMLSVFKFTLSKCNYGFFHHINSTPKNQILFYSNDQKSIFNQNRRSYTKYIH